MQPTPVKPLLRGHFHQAAFFFACGASAMLIAESPNVRVFCASLIYALSLITMFGVSALYHRPSWKEKGRMVMRRLDHAAIYISIAGTGTPVCLLALPRDIGVRLLLMVWAACLFGVAKSIAWTKSPKWLGVVLYVGVGWIYIYYYPELVRAFTIQQIILLVGGGVIYTLGAAIYALRRPNPFPSVFGYHEIFHALVVVAAVMHFLVIRALVV